ncbi:hypothetical protein PCH_Pc21g01850 [Penicillium rubens Wisconsin 54-1255]|uniref:Uncharacterized protein n=1 Tax=Penicillium rubens (strain ATCC 28089 / DSM 1075 / NRRL 1951 / Wisconsin 54-1255) TaxID=500485 RepID=B6HJ81_PENRW|nr:hypothetical protein PCH_Pc21g01850 [Penicillium rubens Wisconsin 54-1255]
MLCVVAYEEQATPSWLVRVVGRGSGVGEATVLQMEVERLKVAIQATGGIGGQTRERGVSGAFRLDSLNWRLRENQDEASQNEGLIGRAALWLPLALFGPESLGRPQVGPVPELCGL